MKALIQACVLALALSVHGQGYVECISTFPMNAAGGSWQGTIGFTFKANEAMSVVQLGVFKSVADTGNFDVGLWGPSGMIGSVTVTPLSPETNFTRYETLPVIASLMPNEVYFIGAYVPVPISLHFAGALFGNTFEVLSTITDVGLAQDTTSPTLTKPTLVNQGEGTLPGIVNFRIIPEPGLGLGAIALAAFVARKAFCR